VFLALLAPAGPCCADQLRGFGSVEAVPLANGQGEVFHCDSPAHAVLLIHKLVHDMALTATVAPQWIKLSFAGREQVPVLVRSGLGGYLVLARGSDAYCFTAPVGAGPVDPVALTAALAFAETYLSGSSVYDPTYIYPYYLDKWTDKGIGTWYSPYDPFGDDPKGLADIVTPHFDYLKQNALAAHVSGWDTGVRESMYWLKTYKTPYHIQQWHEWDEDLARLNPFDLTTPGKEFTAYETYYGQLSYGGDKLQTYRDWSFAHSLSQYVDDPQIVDWDEPHGEIGPEPFRYMYDYGEPNRLHFVKWLQAQKRYTLRSLGQAWYGNPEKYANWGQVPIPFDYSLFGYDPQSCVLAGTDWRIHSGGIADGVDAGYQREAFDDSRWIEMQRPNGDFGCMNIDTHKRFWFRGEITVPASYLAAHRGPIYLNDIGLCSAGGPSNPDHVWFNGVDMGGLSNGGGKWVIGAKDVSGLVHAGINHIVYAPVDPMFSGTFFISPVPVDSYPFADSGRNARYHDWFEYMSFGSMEEERHTLQAMRAVDPNRPIKIMAAGDKDLFCELMYDYGAFPHNTGDEAFFRPWDYRMGYPYGIPGSAESSGSMPDPKWLKRWMGYFFFEGLNAFDNFIDIESMMYTPAAPVWKEYFPYLHLANRYDIKQPEIAILWSDSNDKLTGVPYTFDLGRGDFESIGYSYAYITELSLRRGLAKPYKVLWDDGTWMMSAQTVADLRKYVEGGGTFVALQETGRNTFTKRDAWPIESLTGFKVKEFKPMSGFLSILNDQPLFTKLAGENFENSGKSVDYSGYNFADKSIALEPVAPGTQAIARYRDGSIAIGMRKLGAGRVIVLGSPFWRDSYDNAGIWLPGDKQNAFVTDLLTGLGVPPDVPSDNPLVWKDRYVADNGTEEYLLMWNPSPTDLQTVTAQWNLRYPAAQVFDPKTGAPYPAQVEGSHVQVSATLQPFETLILAAQDQRPPAGTVADWYAKTARVWRQSLPGQAAARPNLPVISQSFDYGAGKVVDGSSVTSQRLVRLSTEPKSETDWDTRLSGIRPFYAGITTQSSQAVLYRMTATMPAGWKSGDRYLLRLNLFRSDSPQQVYLNGVMVADGRKVYEAGEQGVDVSQNVNFGGMNILIVVGTSHGACMAPNISRQAAPANVISLAGEWNVRGDEDHNTAPPTSLPGKFTGIYATKSAMVPRSWAASHVFLRIDNSTVNEPGRYGVNNRLFFTDSFMPRYMDITPWIKFGAKNTFLLLSRSGVSSWSSGDCKVDKIQLERVPVSRL
jgi:hypothetical protein